MHNPAGIYDTAGRYLAPPQDFAPMRPQGPWDRNGAPRAVFAFVQPGFDELPDLPLYHVIGGPSDRSTVTAATLQELGIAVPLPVAA